MFDTERQDTTTFHFFLALHPSQKYCISVYNLNFWYSRCKYGNIILRYIYIQCIQWHEISSYVSQCEIFNNNLYYGQKQHFVCSMNFFFKFSHDMIRSCHNVDGLVQERCNSSVLAMELRLSSTKPSTCNVFSHWLRRCSAIDRKWIQIISMA